MEINILLLIERFGIDGNKPKTLEQLGKETGFSKERIRLYGVIWQEYQENIKESK